MEKQVFMDKKMVWDNKIIILKGWDNIKMVWDNKIIILRWLIR
jgi:hypothetical protein